MSTTTPNLKRENTLKVPLNDVEQAQLRKFCPGQVAPFVRDLIFGHIRAKANRTAPRRRSEWPRHGHEHGQQRFPSRAAVAGGFGRRHL